MFIIVTSWIIVILFLGGAIVFHPSKEIGELPMDEPYEVKMNVIRGLLILLGIILAISVLINEYFYGS